MLINFHNFIHTPSSRITRGETRTKKNTLYSIKSLQCNRGNPNQTFRKLIIFYKKYGVTITALNSTEFGRSVQRECFSHKRSVRVFPIDCCAQTKLPHMISRLCVCMSEMVRSSKVMGVAILTCLLTCASLAARTHTTCGLARL